MAGRKLTALVTVILCFAVISVLGVRAGGCRVAIFMHRFHVMAATSAVDILVDTTRRHQVIDGFGQAEPSVLIASKGPASDQLRRQAAEKAFHEVGINMGIIGSLLESPGAYDQRRNDNNDPFDINWNGFNASFLISAKRYLLDLAKPYGFENYYLGAEAPNVRWASPWLSDIRRRDYDLFLNEAAEQVVANLIWWKNSYGEELDYYQLGNEQLSGNHASQGLRESDYGGVDPVQQVVDLTKRAGARIRSAGFLKTRFMVGTEETEETSLRVATAILNDREAAKYVGAIGYHAYPYYSGYSSVPFILCTSASGKPDAARIRLRNQIRALGTQHNVQIWMTENSHAGKPLSYDDFRARAVQIHDELSYANASAYFGEASMWDLASQRGHFGNDNLYGDDNEGNVVLVNNDNNRVDITGIGYAIGHYARSVKPGAIRLEANSSDPLVQVTAFLDEDRNTITLVIINNAQDKKTVTATLQNWEKLDELNGEQSTPQRYWQKVGPISSSSGNTFSVTLPPTSVTSIVSR